MFNFKNSRWALITSGTVLATSLVACQSQPPTGPSANTSAPATSTAGNNPNSASGNVVALSGAGATFPSPLYQRWFSEYNKQNPNVQISYQSVGSGAGVKQYLAKTVDFGATDSPLNAEERAQFKTKFNAEPIQVPMTGGAVVLAYNLGGNVSGLKLSRQAYCGIVDGTIKNWNDPAIAKENAGAQLPDRPITFVHRSDGSGTTAIFTTHIKAACPNWKAGSGKSVEWPTGIGAKGNEGVTAQIQQTEGTIGYTEYSYASENKLTMASLQNKSGKFVEPSPTSAAKALAGQPIPADFALKVPDPAAAEAYPIVGLTWLLLYPQYDKPETAATLKAFINWALKEGDQYAEELGYLPLANEVAQKVEAAVGKELASSK